ncbi:MAG: CvpA family protein [Gallionella sp.]|nr:MAG: CvpA family protein [Gallionella sp.]
MTGFDFAVIAIVLVSLLLGLWRGLVYEVLSLLGWPIAFVLSRLFANDVAPFVPMEQETLRITVAYVLVFIAALIAWSVLVWLFSKLAKAIGLGWLDRVLGGLFGILRGGLVILAVVWLAGLTDIPKQPFWRTAQMSKPAEDAALLTKAWLPDNIARRIHYGIRS